MERVKNASLVVCLFVVLLVIFASYFRATEVGAFFGARARAAYLGRIDAQGRTRAAGASPGGAHGGSEWPALTRVNRLRGGGYRW